MPNSPEQTDSNSTDGLVAVGTITGVHGVKGLVTIKIYSNQYDSLVDYGPLKNQDGSKTFVPTFKFEKKGQFVCELDNVSDRNQAEALKGTTLYVDESLLPAPQEDEYYQKDLIGLDVKDENSTTIGHVTSVQNYGAGDILEIDFNGNSSDQKNGRELILFNRVNFPVIDIEHGFVTINPPVELEIEKPKTAKTKGKKSQ